MAGGLNVNVTFSSYPDLGNDRRDQYGQENCAKRDYGELKRECGATKRGGTSRHTHRFLICEADNTQGYCQAAQNSSGYLQPSIQIDTGS